MLSERRTGRWAGNAISAHDPSRRDFVRRRLPGLGLAAMQLFGTAFAHGAQDSTAPNADSFKRPAGHHFYEGRWLRNPDYLDDYARFWFRKGGEPRQYSFPDGKSRASTWAVCSGGAIPWTAWRGPLGEAAG